MIMTRKKATIIILILLLLTVLHTSITLGWLSFGGNYQTGIDVGDLDGSIDIIFDDGNTIETNPTSAFNNSRLLELNGVSKEQESTLSGYYLDDLKVQINLNIESASYVRVLVQDEWIVTRTYTTIDREYTEVINHETENLFPYNLVNSSWNTLTTEDPKWFYDEESGYVYFTSFLEKGEYSIPFMYGGDGYIPKINLNYFDTCLLTMNFKVELVQANRYQEIWGITSIPGGK